MRDKYIMARKINSMPIIAIFLLVGIIILVIYIGQSEHKQQHQQIIETPIINISGISTRNSPAVILDPYGPPLRNDGVFFPRDAGDIRGTIPIVPCPKARPHESITNSCNSCCKCNKCNSCLAGMPINVETRGMPMEFTQVGILTRGSGHGNDILSIMGRRLLNGSDKWQYYTMSNSGIMPTKVSISVKGRDAMGEYGVDRLYNGDSVFVDGYEQVYRAKMYENSKFRYIPFI